MQEILEQFHQFSNQFALSVTFIGFYFITGYIMLSIGTWFMKGFRTVKSKIRKRKEVQNQEIQTEEIV